MAKTTKKSQRYLALSIVIACLLEPSSTFVPQRSISKHCFRRGAFQKPGFPRATAVTSSTSLWDASSSSKVAQDEDWTQDEMERFAGGWEDLISGQALDYSNVSKLLTPEDFVGVASMFPLVFESLRTAVTGQVAPDSYLICSLSAVLVAWAHGKMYWDSVRDFRAPRLAEYKSIYEYSALFNLAFAWLLLRIVPDNYAFSLVETLDVPACALLSGITLYGLVYAAYGKKLLTEANNEQGDSYTGPLLPSDAEYQGQAQLYLTGNIILNILACLFLPITWTMVFRGTEWWERVLSLHDNEGAFLGVSVLVALIGNVSGTLLLRLQELGIFKSQRAIVVVGVVSNILLLLFPEILFQVLYSDGISEVGFYWE